MSAPGAVASADVVVVGGGIVGTACAYELTRAGASVVLCEQAGLGEGASGRNPGFVWMHTRRPGTQLVLAKRTRARYETLADEIDADFDFRARGGLILVHTPEQLRVMEEFALARQGHGVNVRVLDGDQVREVAPIVPPPVIGASYCAEDAQITTAKLVDGLALAAERSGAQVLRGTPVRTIRVAGDRATGVDTPAGRIDAGWVVLAAGVWTSALTEGLGTPMPITPMRLQVVATDVQPPMLEHLVYGPSAIRQYDLFHSLPSYREEDFAHPDEDGGLPFLELACQTREGRFLLGCPMDFPGDVWEPDVASVGQICRRLPELLPALAGVRFQRAWAGLLPHTPDSLPVVDELPGRAGVLVAAGHVFGNSSAIATAELVAARITDRAAPFDVDGLGFDRAGLSEQGTRW